MRKKLVIVGLAFVLLCFSALTFYRFFFLHFVRVPTGSMANTILPGDHLVLKKRAFGDINRGDLIAFRYPEILLLITSPALLACRAKPWRSAAESYS